MYLYVTIVTLLFVWGLQGQFGPSGEPGTPVSKLFLTLLSASVKYDE